MYGRRYLERCYWMMKRIRRSHGGCYDSDELLVRQDTKLRSAHFYKYLVNSDRANITIADTYEVAYCLSNGIFTFDIHPF